MVRNSKNKKIDINNKYSVKYGTMNINDCRSIYVNVKSWFKPNFESPNWNGEISRLRGQIKNIIYTSINSEIFYRKFIVDVDISENNIKYNKCSLINITVNLYSYETIQDVYSPEIKSQAKLISNNVIDYLESKTNYYFNVNKIFNVF